MTRWLSRIDWPVVLLIVLFLLPIGVMIWAVAIHAVVGLLT